MPNVDMGDGVTYDPVNTDLYPERPYEDAKQPEDEQTFHDVTYADPNHHKTGNMELVERGSTEVRDSEVTDSDEDLEEDT